ncbi:pentapeptide repeat-containing protein [Microbacterium kribbense]|uniref:Pentapeptide repeat-containing protein n=1 Tax=Microbacterium kribbense TaxID=433645 RepID=A0ABP7GTT7_9MICO
MGRRTATGPVIEPLTLAGLDDGDAGALVAQGMYDATRYADADISGSDLSGASFTECELAAITAHETQLRAARFVQTRIQRLNAPVFTAARAVFRESELSHSRMGSIELYDAEIQSTAITGCKLGFANLRAARLQDVQFTDCTIDELDLSRAELTRVAFRDCTVDTLRLDGARLRHVDLRGLDLHIIAGLEGMAGATISSTQATLMAPLLAEHLRITVDG